MAGRGEVAFAAAAAPRADGFGQLVAVDADIRLAVAAADRDRRGLAAGPAVPAGPASVPPAHLAQRLPGCAAHGHRLDPAAGAAGRGQLPGPAALADAPGIAGK